LPLTLVFFFSLSFTHFLFAGKDLDAVLKATPVLPEREARIIIVQIFRGLVYLNKKAQKIIHYDLKPGNVLFDEFGIAKVTDFGLSKIVEEDVGSQGMELTSQGAGTYWQVTLKFVICDFGCCKCLIFCFKK